MSRIQKAELKDATFTLPDDFDLEQEFRNSFGIFRTDARPTEVVVRFSGIGASLVEERTWHESQRHSWVPAEETLFDSEEPAPDVLVATFRLSDFIEFKRWIKSFGDMAEVLRPDWLRAEMRQELLSAARLYEE